MTQHPTCYTEREAAKLLNWSVKTLQARRFNGRPPAYLKIGKSVRYTSADLQAFMDSCRVEPSQA